MKKRTAALGLTLIAGLAGAAAWHFYRDPLLSAWNHTGIPARLGIPPQVSRPQPQPQRYAELKQQAEAWRTSHASRYRAARTDREREAVLAETRIYLEQLLPEMMSCWVGTPWDFNGTAPGPGAGKIACGYFVATVLKDAGFRVDRHKLAQQASQHIIQTFLPKKSLKVEAGTPYDTYAPKIKEQEPGIRIVGLDHHVAFLVTTADGGFRFIHSSGLYPWCVVDEEQKSAEALRRSNYRVQGLLTADREVLKNWLTSQPLTVVEPKEERPPERKPAAAVRS